MCSHVEERCSNQDAEHRHRDNEFADQFADIVAERMANGWVRGSSTPPPWHLLCYNPMHCP